MKLIRTRAANSQITGNDKKRLKSPTNASTVNGPSIDSRVGAGRTNKIGQGRQQNLNLGSN